MADTAFQTQYRQQFIIGFEQRQSIVRDSVTTEAVIKGNQAVFLVADSGNATPVTRSPSSGLIPGRPDNLSQLTATLVEYHDKPMKTSFNIFASQGNQRAIMQITSMGVINRQIDQDIIGELNTATNDTGVAVRGSIQLVMKAVAILGNLEVPFDGNVFALGTPGLFAFLMQTPEFANALWVPRRPMQDNAPQWADRQGYYEWLGIKWMMHPRLPGAGTSNEQCFMYHRNALGHAANTDGMQSLVGYDEQDDYSWARTSIFMGSKLLQNKGVVVINHDASDFIPT